MTIRPDLNKLAKEVYEANKAKGFHDKEVSDETLLMLVITELSEAVEADRKGKRTEVESLLAFKNNDKIFESNTFELMIKDTVEDELADAVIRILDLVGLRGCKYLYLKDIGLKDLLLYSTISNKKSFPENIFAICTELICYKYNISERVSFALLNLEYLCNLLSIDLWQHVELKLEYNKTRPYKHSKSY